jgi:hypothetical protein
MRLIRHNKLVSAVAIMAMTQLGYARSESTATNAGSKLLSAKAGSELVNVALQYQPAEDVKPDCSHLVYEIYRQAGLTFRFASSRELYAGADPFQRVHRAQVGDLIVWPGHVGIVVNPRERSFFSSLRSGLMIDYYDAAYWTRRGRPRFYRYRASTQQQAVSPRLMRTAHRVPSSSAEAKPDTALEAASEGNVPYRDSSDNSRSRFVIAAAELSAKPTAEEFRGALLHHIDDAGSALESSRVLDTNASVLVVDDIAVERLKLKKEQGSLEIQLDCPVAVVNGNVTENPPSQKRKLNLEYSNGGWLVEDKDPPLYVPRQIALRVFAAQLATATRLEASNEEIAKLLRILNALAPEK